MSFRSGRQSQRLGIALFVWSALCALARVVVGLHFPADILAAACIGIFTAWIFHREIVLKPLERCVAYFDVKVPILFNAAVCIVVFEIGNLFVETRMLDIAVFSVISRYLHIE